MRQTTLNLEHLVLLLAGPVFHTSTRYMDFVEHLVLLLAGPVFHTSTRVGYMDFVEFFNISLDLSTIYFAHSTECLASFVYSYHSILECYNMFSGVI